MGIRGKGNGASWSGLVIIIALGTDEVHFFPRKVRYEIFAHFSLNLGFWLVMDFKFSYYWLSSSRSNQVVVCAVQYDQRRQEFESLVIFVRFSFR